MKLIFAGTDREKEWFKSALGCPHGVPCPRHQGDRPLGNSYPCADCYANNHASTNVTYVDELPDISSTDKVDIVAQLKKHVSRFKNCDGCTFVVNGKCFFDYNCPADLTEERGAHNG